MALRRNASTQGLSSGRRKRRPSVVAVLAMIAAFLIPSAAGSAAEGVPEAAIGTAGMPVGVVFAPDTAPDYAGQVVEELFVAQRLLPQPQQFTNHWNPAVTALKNGGIAQGDAVELTWSIIPDGTLMPSQAPFDTTCTSNLIATLDGVFGAGLWQAEIQRVWDDWTNNAANVYTPAVALDANGTPVDDGAAWPISPGVAGIRGDVRIGGCTIDGNSNVLAYNFSPSNGDMKIDAPDSFYSVNPLSPHFHNVFSHEHGHGAGLAHVCPTDSTKLMEPLINTNFLGLQHDDLRGVQRGYGDRFEVIGSPNDGVATATGLMPVGGQTETVLSLDGTSDEDWFSFSATTGDVLDVTVTATGSAYLEGPDPLSDLCAGASPTLIDSQALQDLSFEIHNNAGLLTTINAAGAGSAEAITGFPIGTTGTHYIRVLGSGADDAQLYDLFVETAAGGVLCNGLVPTDVVPPGGVPFIGSGGADVILGTSGPDVISGFGGDDVICGLGGDDTIAGNAGDDIIFGDGGVDTIFGGPNNDTIFGGADADSIQGNDGVDTLNGDAGDDVLSGNDGDDTLNGGADNDTLYGVAGVDTINGDAGQDTILGGLDGDIINGGPDNDLISGNAGGDTINGDDGDDTLYGSTEGDIINGGAGLDIILGGTGNDTLNGGPDRDLISGNENDDTINGGSGNDDLFGVDGDDIINGDGGTDLILGGNDADTIDGGTEGDLISGNAGNDVIDGGDGDDEIYGVTGTDTLTGGAGADIILGGPNDDIINSVGDGSVDQVSGNAGTDTCNTDNGPLIVDNVFLCELP